MRQIKTILKNVSFTKVTGYDFYNDFFNEKGDVEIESVIESVYCNSILKASNGNVDIIKKKLNKGITDGLIRFRYNDKIEFTGIQECKRNIKRNTKSYKYQLIQSLLYYIQTLNDCKVIIINSINYFDYIIIKENDEFINTIKNNLLELLNNYSPSKACKMLDIDISNFKIHTCNVPDKTEINNIILNIYRNCI